MTNEEIQKFDGARVKFLLPFLVTAASDGGDDAHSLQGSVIYANGHGTLEALQRAGAGKQSVSVLLKTGREELPDFELPEWYLPRLLPIPHTDPSNYHLELEYSYILKKVEDGELLSAPRSLVEHVPRHVGFYTDLRSADMDSRGDFRNDLERRYPGYSQPS